MRRMNLPEAAIADALASLPPEDVEIWPWQQKVVDAFHLASTQWRWTSGMSPSGAVVSRITGLDYTGAEVAWRLAGVTLTPDEFEDVRAMEVAVSSGGVSNG